MTDLISRPPRPRPARPTRTTRGRAGGAARRPTVPPTAQPVPLAGVLAALRAAGLGLLAVMVLVLVAWATAADSGASASEAVHAGLSIWLVGHFARLTVPGGEFGLAPLGLTLLPAALLFSSASRAARAAQVRGRRAVVALTASLSASYAAVAVVVALLAGTDPVTPLPVSAFLGAAALATLAGGAGALRGSGRAVTWWLRLPCVLRLGATGAAGAVAVLLAGSAALVAVLLARHHAEAERLVDGLGAGLAGSLLVLLICVLYAPNAVVWAATYLVGPGFAVGSGTTVAVTGVHLGAVPAVPLLAALPADAPGSRTGVALMVCALALAGAGAGLLVDRSARRQPADPLTTWRELGQVSAATGGLAAVVLALLAASASGPAGPGRLAHTGSPWWQVGLLAAVETATLTALVLAARRPMLLRGLRRYRLAP